MKKGDLSDVQDAFNFWFSQQALFVGGVCELGLWGEI